MRSFEAAGKPIRFMLVAAGAALIGGLVLAAPASASPGVLAAGYDIQDRGPSLVADVLALAGVAVGALARGRRAAAVAAIVLGAAGVVVAAVALAIADGGPGTGNGVVGSALAVVLGLIAAALGRRALNRARRAT